MIVQKLLFRERLICCFSENELTNPSDDEPQAAGAAASTDLVDLDPSGEGAAQGAPVADATPPEPVEPFWAPEPFLAPEAKLDQGADDLPLGTRRLFNTVLLSTKGRKSREGAPGKPRRAPLACQATAEVPSLPPQ